MTLAELLVSGVVMTLIAGAMGALALTVHEANREGQGSAEATQHAQVILERIERSVRQAHANREFPGAAVFSQTSGSYEFPDTLVVWNPEGAPQNPDGRPLFSELVVYTPHPGFPHRLLELTDREDLREAPPLADTTLWQSELDALRQRRAAEATVLTQLLRTSRETVSDYTNLSSPQRTTAADSSVHGGVRFLVETRPSLADVEAAERGDLAWTELPWPLDLYSTNTGTARTRCAIELQLMPGVDAFERDPSGQSTRVYFGSAATRIPLLSGAAP